MDFNSLMQTGIRTVRRNQILFIIPLVLDLILYGSLAFSGISMVEFKLTLPSSLPSIINILPDAAKVSGESGFIMGYPGTLTSGFFGFLITFILLPFLTGGYLGTIVEELENRVERTPFFTLGLRYFGRIFIMRLLVMVMFLVLLPIVMIIPILIIVIFVLIIYLAVLFLFWEFSIVNDNVDLFKALRKASKLLGEHLGQVAGNLIPVFVLMAILTLAASYFMNTVFLFVMITVYAYTGSIIISAMMAMYRDLSKSEEVFEQ